MIVQAQTIIQIVADYYGIDVSDILQWDRFRSIARARQIAAFLVREQDRWSYPEIGRFFSNRDHTTIMSACKRVRKLIAEDERTRADVEEIRKRVAERIHVYSTEPIEAQPETVEQAVDAA